jgi:hypothetical protein
MAEGNFFSTNEASVSDGSAHIVDPSISDTGAAEIHTVAGTGSATVYKDIDIGGDGTYSLSIVIDTVESPSSSWHSQNNKIEISSAKGHRLRIVNNDGAPRSFHTSGIEITD